MINISEIYTNEFLILTCLYSWSNWYVTFINIYINGKFKERLCAGTTFKPGTHYLTVQYVCALPLGFQWAGLLLKRDPVDRNRTEDSAKRHSAIL